MSTRWYPLYQRGNPQLRVFLPNFWMKLVAPADKQPSNVVTFHCSMEMTRFDVKNYLEKIYNVYPAHVRMTTRLGEFKYLSTTGYVTKDDDIKVAYVILPKDQSFTFPELFKEKKGDKRMSLIEKSEEQTFNKIPKDKVGPGLSSWF